MRPAELAQATLDGRRVGHHPTIDGRLIDREAALQKHLLDVAAAQCVAQVPEDRLDDQLRLDLPTAEVSAGLLHQL